ncbi:unnamed protein product [Psylliodes chrysocephalus]|uniref:Mutator-like transposase domain-containing protein n=1 Tax=Psylliodes chrysocephalus TaxID=3402493 RepID=A0A9P0CRA8_9CUCU|nr:unnamed protein product [Psylliodes chrysocephala]
MHGSLVGDADSSITKQLSSHKLYGATPIQKIECVNHLLRNFCNKLKDLSSPSSHLIIPLNLRKKLESNILRFRISIKKAAAFRIQMTVPLAEKIPLFQNDIKNFVAHIFGEYSNCEEYFCKGTIDQEENIMPELIRCGFIDDIMACL